MDKIEQTPPPRIPRSIRARVRSRVRRSQASAEEEKESSGELNLVPFLDILINTLIFLLASTAVATPLAHIKTTTPVYTPDPGPEGPKGGEKLFTVAIGRDGFYLGGVGGVLGKGDGPSVPCAGPRSRCISDPMAGPPGSFYDYGALAAKARKLKAAHPKQRRVILTADKEVPYHVMVATMDALRGTAKKPLFDQIAFSSP